MFTYLGAMSDPCCMRLPQLCQKQLWRVNSFSSSSGSSTQGWGFSHSKGVSLREDQEGQGDLCDLARRNMVMETPRYAVVM